VTVLVEVTVSLLIEVDTLISVVVTGEVGGEREDLNQDSEKNIISNHSRGSGAQNL
jgi:hypothetical protein